MSSPAPPGTVASSIADLLVGWEAAFQATASGQGAEIAAITARALFTISDRLAVTEVLRAAMALVGLAADVLAAALNRSTDVKVERAAAVAALAVLAQEIAVAPPRADRRFWVD